MSARRYLLDTHVVLWLLLEPARVRQDVRDIVKARDQIVGASAVTGWEVSLKQSTGKLTLPAAAEEWLQGGMGAGWHRPALHGLGRRPEWAGAALASP